MADHPEETQAAGSPDAGESEAVERKEMRRRSRNIHEVSFTSYPKLLFVWPIIVAGIVLWPLGAPVESTTQAVAATQPAVQPAGQAPGESDGIRPVAEELAAERVAARAPSARLGYVGWIYIWVMAVVLVALGVDIDRNRAAFWVVFVVAIWVLGLWLRDSKGFTLFGDIHRWFTGLGVQYDRSFGLALSIMLLVPFAIMLFWARINDRWRITHNEFEHYSFGKMDDSLGRGAKTIRTSFPDVMELLLGLAGTLVVYNATGTKELRRIPHVMFLPFIRRKLNRILEKTAITAAQIEDSEEEDEDM